MLKKAAVGAVGLGVLGPASSALAAATRSEADTVKTLVTTAVTAEALAVTVLTAAVNAIPGTPPEKYKAVLKAANTTEFRHYQVLSSLGAKPLTTRFWIPDAALGAGAVRRFPRRPAQERHGQHAARPVARLGDRAAVPGTRAGTRYRPGSLGSRHGLLDLVTRRTR